MDRNLTSRLAPLTLVLMLVGCGVASDDGDSSEDTITPQEVAEGEAGATVDVDGDDDEAFASIDDLGAAALEDSSPYLDAEEAARLDPKPAEDIEVEGLDQTMACTKVTGYRKGKAQSICVTTIDGKNVEVNTARAYLRMRTAAKKAGASIVVVSGFRTMAKQRELYRLYKAGRGNLAAAPGYSNHQSGHALDLNTKGRGVYSWLTKHGKEYGFRRTVPSEKWHWEK